MSSSSYFLKYFPILKYCCHLHLSFLSDPFYFGCIMMLVLVLNTNWSVKSNVLYLEQNLNRTVNETWKLKNFPRTMCVQVYATIIGRNADIEISQCLCFMIFILSLQNLPFSVDNKWRLLGMMVVFFGSGFAFPFIVVRHQILKK